MSIAVAFLFILLATVCFLLAEVAVPRNLFQEILGLIDDLRRRPVPASAEEIHGEVKTMGEVRLDDGKCGQMIFWTPTTDENRVIWKATEDNHSNDVAILLRSPCIRRLSGKCRVRKFSLMGEANERVR